MERFEKEIRILIRRWFPKFTGSITLHIRDGEVLEWEENKRKKIKSK